MKAPVIALIIGAVVTASAIAQEMPGEHNGMDPGTRTDRSGEQAQDRSMERRMMQGRMGMHQRMMMNESEDRAEDMGSHGQMEMMCPMMDSAMMRDAMGSGMRDRGMGRRGMMREGMPRFDMMRGAMGSGNRDNVLFGTRVRPLMNLSVEDVRGYLDSQLERLNNKRLKVGSINAEDKIITAEVVTLDDSLVQRLKIDRRTGRIEYVE